MVEELFYIVGILHGNIFFLHVESDVPFERIYGNRK